MTTVYFRKGLVLVLICSFIGTGFVPIISGNYNFDDPPEIDWDKTYGGPDLDFAWCVQQINDGGYIIAGGTNSYGAGDRDLWLVKTDSNGNKLWDKTFGGADYEEASCVQQINNGGYIITGGTNSYGSGNTDVWLVKTDSNGTKLWDKTFGGTGYDIAYSVTQTNDDGYILTGETYSYGSGNTDLWLIKTDSNGSKLWDKTFGGIGYDRAYCVQQTNDDGYILTGTTDSYGAGAWDLWLVKTDSNGNKLWDKTFGGSSHDGAECVQQTNDGGYILTGRTFSYGSGNGDFWLVKTDSSGSKLWDKTFGGADYEEALCVQQTNNGGYILAGTTESYGAGNGDFWLVKTDSSGNKLWDKTFGGGSIDFASCVQQTNDGGYIITGFTDSYGAGDGDFWLVKLSSDENIIIEIHGGFRLSAAITNTGSEALADVPWSIDLDGGLILVGDHSEGVISDLGPGAATTIRQSSLYGIGNTVITATVGDATKQATGFVLGPLVLGIEEI